MTPSPERTQQMLTLLVVGLYQQQQQAHSLSSLNPYIKQAWEYICLAALLTRTPLPETIADFVYLLHQPVEDWPLIGTHIAWNGPILAEGELTPHYYARAEQFASTYNPHLELEDAHFRHIYELCRHQADEVSYQAIRTFLVRNPIYSDLNALETPEWDEVLTKLLLHCYERIPLACVRGDQAHRCVVRCPHCGWPLVWDHRGKAYCHENGTCAELFHPLADYEQDEQYRVPYHHDLVRTKEGIQRFVVAPEVALMALVDALQNEWNVQQTLYPGMDSYDLLVILPDGQRWAVDMKDWKNAISLALGTANAPFSYVPPWDRAFYVFPDYRATAGYLNEFRSYWTHQNGVHFMSMRQFLRLVWEASR